MNPHFWLRKLPVSALIILLVLTATAWQQQPRTINAKPVTDTVPDRSKKVRDIDEALQELEKQNLQKRLQEVSST